ncbi:uncharacterized protein LOC117123090, partial [Anneissia japonica]|uniref:uncharacterized protein LOC117123090 n=1 Tax=Anneissia japonica TaxID=1529436 RepID=UPI001425687B
RNCLEPLKVRECRNGPKGAPWAQRTTLGWTISGQICKSGAGGKVYASVNRTVVEPTCLYQSDGICTNHIYIKDRPHITTTKTDIYVETKDECKIAMSMEDERFIQKMQLGAHTNANGNLEFPLPFKEDDVNLPNNRSQAQYRLKNLLKTLNRKPEAMEEYKQFISKILSRNHASPVPESDINPLPGKAWYLPHFPVHHPKKNSLRVVFDGSAEFNGCSLNKALLRGPEHMNSLLGVLLRFRIGNIAVMGDIEQMFHNFYVDTPDRNFLHFLWFKDNDTSQPIVEYRMNVHLFGSTSSPAVATFGLRMIADNCKDTHGEDVAEFIHQDFYVDDGITSKPDVESTISLIKRSCAALMTKRLRFHKIVCNSIDVLKALPEEDINKDLKSVELHKDDLPTQRTLGVHWDLESDTLTFHVSLPNKPFSRRGVLSVSSSIFDPLGLVAPVTIEGKIMLRELMKNTKHGNKTSQNCWDSPLPERYLSKWIGWKDSLYELQNIQLPRCYQPPNFGPIRRREIHVFSDASDVAIGAVAYLRQINKDGEPHVAFLKGKSKLTPKHAVSIPRLELCAAVLATNIVENIKAEIENRMPVDSIMYYTDSKVVLGYISNESKRFHVYVANRVHRIHSVSDRAQWCHIDTDHNPADMALRSTRADRLMDTTWFTGPDFLWETKLITTNRQLTSTVKEIDEGDPEVRKQIKILKTDAQAHTHFQNRFCHFSRWLVLRRAIAILITRARHLKPVSYTHLDVYKRQRTNQQFG